MHGCQQTLRNSLLSNGPSQYLTLVCLRNTCRVCLQYGIRNTESWIPVSRSGFGVKRPHQCIEPPSMLSFDHASKAQLYSSTYPRIGLLTASMIVSLRPQVEERKENHPASEVRSGGAELPRMTNISSPYSSQTRSGVGCHPSGLPWPDDGPE